MKEQHSPNQSRRDFVKTTATVMGVTAIAPGILFYSVSQARPIDQAVTAEVRWGMLIDTTRCAEGCDACVSACGKEHGLVGHDRPQTDATWIRKIGLRDKQTGREYTLPMMCQHCESPPCADVCPTGASFKRADGIVLVDKHICIGCRYCMMACPYKARSFVHEEVTKQKTHTPRGKGTVEACTLCVHRVDQGKQPACAEACPSQAILFGDINDSNSEKKKN
jgi:molybdopterin-containing oxidoreductase family iron-sulfur binding subunit